MSIKQKNKGNITKPCFLTLIRITMVLLSSAILVRYMKVYPKNGALSPDKGWQYGWQSNKMPNFAKMIWNKISSYVYLLRKTALQVKHLCTQTQLPTRTPPETLHPSFNLKRKTVFFHTILKECGVFIKIFKRICFLTYDDETYVDMLPAF